MTKHEITKPKIKELEEKMMEFNNLNKKIIISINLLENEN